jgi:hypothetical protein
MPIPIVQPQEQVGRDGNNLRNLTTEDATDCAEAYTCSMWAMERLLAESYAGKSEAVMLEFLHLRFSVTFRVDVLVCLAGLFVYDHTHSFRPNENSELLRRACTLVHDVERIGQG